MDQQMKEAMKAQQLEVQDWSILGMDPNPTYSKQVAEIYEKQKELLDQKATTKARFLSGNR